MLKKLPDAKSRKIAVIFAYLLALVIFSGMANAADVIAVSQLGFHPLSSKQVIVYTDANGGNFDIKNSANGNTVASFSLQKPKDFSQNNVECQGNMPCLVGDFTGFDQEGTFYAQSSGLKSRNFEISSNIYADTVPILLEFFNAQKQQNSDYHADMHSGYMPPLTIISDGSFIMEAHQAASTLIRLGSAYRRNPSLFQSNEMKEHILDYIKYLEGLQGISVNSGDSPNAVRLGYGMKINNVFVPGPTSLAELDVYKPTNPPEKLPGSPFPVVSLCGADNSTLEWNKCVQDAATFYKCQINEPCLDISYNDAKGTLSNGNGYAVSRGWNYEFGCFFDVNLNEEMFNDKSNPCLVFYPQTLDDDGNDYTSQALLAFLEAYPAVKDSPEGQPLLERAVNTYNYLKTSPGTDPGYIGTALFLLHDYFPGNNYLQEAYSFRSSVSTQFISDKTRGNEFYWEEYIRHKDAIIAAGLDYGTPEEYFRGKMFNDWKDSGDTSISNNGERIYQFDHNILFQNSRYILTEGLLAAKTTELASNAESFITIIADMQLAWLTGMNNVQQGVGLNAPTKSMSFIFGIGDFPEQFHSRYLVDTGYNAASQGSIIGARGTGLQFLDSSDNKYYYLDGRSNILGYSLGALGNEWKNEAKIEPYNIGKTFKNGKKYISGWINGPFDTKAGNEDDIIFNYHDDLNTYQFTESTDEIVATAIELVAYLDGQKNKKPRHDGTVFNLPDILLPGINATLGNQTGQNQTGQSNGSLSIHTTPSIASVFLDANFMGDTDAQGDLYIPSIEPNTYNLKITKQGHSNHTEIIQINESQNLSLSIILAPGNQTNNQTNSQSNQSSLTVNTNPGIADVFLNFSFYGTTNSNGALHIPTIAAGDYLLMVDKEGYQLHKANITIASGQNLSVAINLVESNFSNSSAKITKSSTNLSKLAASSNGAEYYMREDSGALFNVDSNDSNIIKWYVNGEFILTTVGKNSTLKWSPGVLWSPRAPDYSNIALATIEAMSPTESIEWKVGVENVINPFFSGIDGNSDSIGSPDTQIRVFTNNKLVDFTHVNVTIQSQEGDNVVQSVYALQKGFTGNNETDWKKDILNVPYGNNYIVKITGFNDITKNTVTYGLGLERSHYRNFPQSSARIIEEKELEEQEDELQGVAELVYATFGEDVVGLNDSQTITLDAKNFNGGVYRVDANIISPLGEARTINLQLIKGTREYGTWHAQFDGFVTGMYVLHSVVLNSMEVTVGDRSFYVVDDIVAANEHLMLVYSLLSHSSVKNGTNVTFRMDARDADGIISAAAEIKTSRGKTFTMPLSLVGGNKNYGTWQGTFKAAEPDTTYTIARLTLSNKEQSKTYEISNRAVYVLPVPGSNLAAATGYSTGFFSGNPLDILTKKPIVPTLIGFGIMFFVIGTMMMGQKMKKRSRPDIAFGKL